MRRLWVSEADRNTFTSSIRARSRSASARSRPRSLGISTETLTSLGISTALSTSSASASWGITSGRTNDVTSIRGRPVRASALISSTFSAVEIVSGSFWKPSRGPTSRMLTLLGRRVCRESAAALGEGCSIAGGLHLLKPILGPRASEEH